MLSTMRAEVEPLFCALQPCMLACYSCCPGCDGGSCIVNVRRAQCSNAVSLSTHLSSLLLCTAVQAAELLLGLPQLWGTCVAAEEVLKLLLPAACVRAKSFSVSRIA